jgi:serine/threonine-protein kinase HipA
LLHVSSQGVRLSLAGVQDKLAVYVKDEKIFIPLGNAPSTHILKPDFLGELPLKISIS